MGDGFYRSKDPTNSIKLLKEEVVKENSNLEYSSSRSSKVIELGVNRKRICLVIVIVTETYDASRRPTKLVVTITSSLQ